MGRLGGRWVGVTHFGQSWPKVLSLLGFRKAVPGSGGAGADELTGGAGADVFLFVNGDTGIALATADIIQDFTSVDDLIDSGITVGAYTEMDGVATANEAAFLTNASTAIDTAFEVYVEYNVNGSGDAWVAIDFGSGSWGGWRSLHRPHRCCHCRRYRSV